MVTVKICSNPYQQEIKFYKWNEREDDWDFITYDENPNSQLISEKIIHSFFTFKAEEIIRILVDEYDDGETFNIEFEGTHNEYQELRRLVDELKQSMKQDVTVVQTNRYLENAETVLPTVISIFNRMVSIIPESIRNDEDISKFKEASNDIIPLVIVGNYSAGKSTFINSLIGYDILPNSDSPVTAKIIKIFKANEPKTIISFTINDSPVNIIIEENQYRFETEVENIEDVFSAVIKTIEDAEIVSTEKKINAFLTEINELDAREDIGVVSELVTVSTPFNKGVLPETKHQFVLFDTPGSNSSSNSNHFEVLKSAMKNMSNGLVLFVTEYTSLDTIDNAKLFDELKNIKEIDSRFTMIIVNKADGADFSDFNERQLLNQAVPKNLFSEGIFFVSSIMGLGSKNGGQFTDVNYDRVFKRSFDEFGNPNAEYYQQLYQYNIVPTQLKQRVIDQAHEFTDLVYVNSGLYSIEKEIQTFSEHYSAYNKCQQSKLYLEKIIEKTEQTVQDLKTELDKDVKQLHKDFESKKQYLIDIVEKQNNRQLKDYNQTFGTELSTQKQSLSKFVTYEQLQEKCNRFYKVAKVEFELEKYEMEGKEAQKTISKHFWRNVEHIKNTKDFSHIGQMFQQVTADWSNSKEDNNEYRVQKNKAYDRVSNQMIDTSIHQLVSSLQVNKNDLYCFSVTYWEDCSRQLREKLSTEIGASDILSIERQQDIQRLILDYQSIQLEADKGKIFKQADLAEGFRIGNLNLFGNSHKLDLKKVAKKYNDSVRHQVNILIAEIQKRHQEDFEKWSEALIQLIKENIVDFNPDLREANQSIIQKEKEIKDYEAKLVHLVASTNEIKQLLSFKESQ